MKNPRVIAGVVVAALIVTVAVAMLLDRGPAAAAEDPASSAPVVTAPADEPGVVAPQPTGPPPNAPTPPPVEGPAPDDDEDDHDDVGGLDDTLTVEERSVAWDAAVAVASAVTQQDPNEVDRAARLAPLFAAGVDAIGVEGPAPHGAVVVPATLNWVKPLEAPDQTMLRLLVSVQYDVVRPTPNGDGKFGQGNAEWFIDLVRDATGGWLAADVVLSTSSDM